MMGRDCPCLWAPGASPPANVCRPFTLLPALVCLVLAAAVCCGEEAGQANKPGSDRKPPPSKPTEDQAANTPKPQAGQTQSDKTDGEKPPATAKDLFALPLADILQIKVATVTTASKAPEKATSAPGTAIVIDKRDIQLRGYSNLKDVLRDLPGMETIENSFSEWGTQVPIRGISGNNKIVVLVNGMRVNPPGGENFPFRSDFSVRDAEQVEVIYGPGSTLYGQDAISAVINVKTQKPADRPIFEAGGDGGLNNEREAWFSFAKVLNKTPDINLTAYLQYHDSDLTRLDKAYPAYWSDYKAIAEPKGSGTVPFRKDLGINGFLRLEVGDSSLQAWHRQSTRSSAEGFSPILAFLPDAIWSDHSTVVEGKNTLTLNDKMKLDSAFTFNQYEIEPDSRYVHAESETQWFLDDLKYGLGRGYTLEETLNVHLDSKISLLAGVVASHYSIIPKATIFGGADLDDDLLSQQNAAIPYFTVAGDPDSQHLIPGVVQEKYQRYGSFFELGYQMIHSLKTVFGLRLDRDSRIVKPAFTPRFAAIYDITGALTAKYMFTRAYVAPAPYFEYGTFDNGTRLSTSDPTLQPEKAESHELNFSYSKKNMSLGLSTYFGRQSSLVQESDRPIPDTVIQDPVFLDLAGTQRRTLVHSVNAGTSRNLGLDLYGRATVGRVSPWFSYSYVDFKETTGMGTTGLQGSSRHNGRLGATWAATERFFVTPSFVIRSTPESVIPGRLGHELQTPWEINLHMLYKASKHFDVFLDMRNITNHKYALGGFTGEAIPQETIRGVLGMRMSW